jgi:uncharacterized iron-regulated protein
MKHFLLFAIAFLYFPFCYGQSTFSQCQTYLKQNKSNPTDYLINKFNTYDLVILGEDHAVKQNLDFVESLIPQLYEKGVFNICMEFGASEKQKQMDSLTTAEQFNEAVAKEMMYYYNVGWAYKEYYSICEAVWKFNKSLPPESKKFRIINLSYQYNWSELKKGEQRTPDNMNKVFAKGTPDKFRATIIENEILKQKQKALLLVGTPHAYTKYSLCHNDFLKDNFCNCDSDWLGQRLIRKHPDKVYTIILHQPFYNFPNRKPFLISPCNGMIEQLMAENNNTPFGFDLGKSPMGSIADSSRNSLCYRNFTLGELFDGYIFLVPFSKMQGCTTDTSFFSNKTWESIKAQIPDPDWHGEFKSVSDFWKQITDYADIKKRYKDLFE